MKIKQIVKVGIVLALALCTWVGVATMLSLDTPAPVRAQGIDDQIGVHKQLGRSSPIVYVGEYITFTIRVRNNTAFTVTTLPMSDVFNTDVLRYVDARPVSPDAVNEGAGTLEWNDLTAHYGDLAPGQEVMLTVGFIAEHPQNAIVNRASVHDALGSGGAFSDTNSTVTDTESIGGSSPVDKQLLGDLLPHAGLPLTFTIAITNQGYATMTVVPLVDTYSPTLMTFSHAFPPPDLTDLARGVLTWTDVTIWTGDIPPHGTIIVTTVFTALTTSDEAINQAEVIGGEDWYGNDVGGGADEVPITILPAPTAVPPTPTARPPQPPGPTSPPAPTPTQGPGVTPTPTKQPPAVMLLPETGQIPWWAFATLGVALILLLAGGIMLRRKA